MLLTGASPSLMRAAIMGALYLTATLLGRPNSGFVSLLVAGGSDGGTAADGGADVSFQLSFAATAGLIVLVPLLRERIVDASRAIRRLPEPLQQGLAGALFEIAMVTAAASLATLPLIALHFQRVSLVALPANLLVLPAFPFIMLSSAFVALVGLVWQPLGAFRRLFRLAGPELHDDDGAAPRGAAVRLAGAAPVQHRSSARRSMSCWRRAAWLLSRRRPGGEALRRFWRPVRTRPGRCRASPLRAVPTVWLAGWRLARARRRSPGQPSSPRRTDG